MPYLQLLELQLRLQLDLIGDRRSAQDESVCCCCCWTRLSALHLSRRCDSGDDLLQIAQLDRQVQILQEPAITPSCHACNVQWDSTDVAQKNSSAFGIGSVVATVWNSDLLAARTVEQVSTRMREQRTCELPAGIALSSREARPAICPLRHPSLHKHSAMQALSAEGKKAQRTEEARQRVGQVDLERQLFDKLK